MKLIKRIAAVLLALTVTTAALPIVHAEETGFVHADGTQIIGTDGQPLQIKGMALGCNVWDNTSEPPKYHHTEDTYRELSELGFNSVRLYLNYRLFEDDSAPYEYLQSGFDWIDTNIAWAKKYGMGIILNMHYPQGGYQSGGDGLELWSEPENLERLTALWKAIAQHCADEPAIWGYGLVNEPYLPMFGNTQTTINYYTNAVRKMTSAIREVSPYQAIFAERIINISGGEVNWDLSAESAFPLIDDDNVVYEFHYYQPFDLTHSVKYDRPYPPQYPRVDLDRSIYVSTWVGTQRAEMVSERSGGWSYFESEPVSLTDEHNVGILALNAGKIGSGKVYFDNIKVTEISESGKRVLLEYNFDAEGEANCFYNWTADGSGTGRYDADGRSGGCYVMYGTDMDFTAGADRFLLEEGKQYVVSGYVRTSGEVGYYSPRIDFAKVSEIVTVDKAYLKEQLTEYAEFSERHDVPLYLGEFGCCNDAFEDGESALNWVGDMIDICTELSIGFNYHTYHEGWFGFYHSSGYEYPAPENRNDALAELFGEKLNAPTASDNTDDIRSLLKRLLPFI